MRALRRRPSRSLDKAGNAVALTYPSNAFYGGESAGSLARPASSSTMRYDNFTTKPGVPNMYGLVMASKNADRAREASALVHEPDHHRQGRTHVHGDRQSGGSRIISIMLETVMNIIDMASTLEKSYVDATHFHHQWMPDEVLDRTDGAVVRHQEAAHRNGLQDHRASAVGYRRGDPGHAGSGRSHCFSRSGTAAESSCRRQKMKPGMIYGANDNRWPAGAAVGNRAESTSVTRRHHCARYDRASMASAAASTSGKVPAPTPRCWRWP